MNISEMTIEQKRHYAATEIMGGLSWQDNAFFNPLNNFEHNRAVLDAACGNDLGWSIDRLPTTPVLYAASAPLPDWEETVIEFKNESERMACLDLAIAVWEWRRVK